MKKIVILSLLMFCASACGFQYSDGERTGVVQKLSRKGIFVKTWEGEMAMSGTALDDQGRIVPNIFKFTIDQEDLVGPVKIAMVSGDRVTIKYHQKIYVLNSFHGDTRYFVRSVEVLK